MNQINFIIFASLLLVKYGHSFEVEMDTMAVLVESGQFPFHIWFKFNVSQAGPNMPNILRTCEGSLIHPEWGISSAHCFDKSSTDVRIVSKSVVYAGYDETKEGARYHGFVHKVILHPDYTNSTVLDGITRKNDIALVNFDKFKINKYVRLAYLPKPTEKRCVEGVTLGFGSKKWDYPIFNKKLRFTRINTTDKSGEIYSNSPTYFFSRILTNHSQCFAGGHGSPFVCEEDPRNHTFVQYGIMSYVRGSDLYIRVSFEGILHHLKFINRYIPEIKYRTIKKIPKNRGANLVKDKSTDAFYRANLIKLVFLACSNWFINK